MLSNFTLEEIKILSINDKLITFLHKGKVMEVYADGTDFEQNEITSIHVLLVEFKHLSISFAFKLKEHLKQILQRITDGLSPIKAFEEHLEASNRKEKHE